LCFHSYVPIYEEDIKQLRQIRSGAIYKKNELKTFFSSLKKKERKGPTKRKKKSMLLLMR